ncbi:MAG TPA: PilZ domain-containing protein [Pirellulales bacterium]|jgi:hypothetical protein|nr:PilZ domain-containing protein [Pirellulales bacterium]
MPSTPAAEPIEGLAEAVERVAASTPASESLERRGAKRFPFRVLQFMAQYDRTGMPSRDRFQQVRCQDLSTSGVSFLWPRIPDFEYVVIGLETAGPPIHVTARVTSVRPSPNEPGQLLVGCQFTGKVNTY